MNERQCTCCFTGHRPERLPWGNSEGDPRCAALKRKLYAAVNAAYESGMRYFICGMARGSDFYFAEAVLALREKYPDVQLEAAVPYPGQASRWSEEDQTRWRRLLAACSRQTMVQHHYSRLCMIRRNQYMVDRSALVIAVYDGQEGGGTRNTLEYAIRQKVPFVDIDPHEAEEL